MYVYDIYIFMIYIFTYTYIYMYIPVQNIRVMGELAVSRSFGDSEFKKGLHVSTIFIFATRIILFSCIYSNNMYIPRN
jgi:hypothetical protein